MKLFGRNKEKVIRVKITNDSLPFNLPEAQPSPPKIDPEPKQFKYEPAVKVAGLVVVVFHSLLAIMGYVDFTGQLETLGISTNEIDLGLPTLLFQGYLAVVLPAFAGAADWFPMGVIAVTIIPAVVFYYPVSKVFAYRPLLDKAAMSLLLSFCFFTISVIPAVGLNQGQYSAYKTFGKQNPFDQNKEIRGLSREVTIVTKEGPTLSGDTVYAGTLYTYVLQGPELYKIANRDNHIVSVTKIDPLLRSKAKKTVEGPKASKAES